MPPAHAISQLLPPRPFLVGEQRHYQAAAGPNVTAVTRTARQWNDQAACPASAVADLSALAQKVARFGDSRHCARRRTPSQSSLCYSAIGRGLVASLAHPAGNITGFT